MANHVNNRRDVIDRLRRELVGPDPHGAGLSTEAKVEFRTPKAERDEHKDDPSFVPQALRPWTDAATHEEILTHDRPCKRYGVGVLYPLRSRAADPADPVEGEEVSLGDDEDAVPEVVAPEGEEAIRQIEDRADRRSDAEDPGDPQDGLAAANAFFPSAMGVSFLVEVPSAKAHIELTFRGGRYIPFSVRIGDRSQRWWRRVSISGSAMLALDELGAKQGASVLSAHFTNTERIADSGPIALQCHVVVRRHERPDEPGQSNNKLYLLTITVLNRSPEADPPDELCVFQSEFDVALVDAAGGPLAAVHPYPRAREERLDEQEEEIELLYSRMRTFAVGHGCAADWQANNTARATMVCARPFPIHETPSITPEVRVNADLHITPDGELLSARMAALAGLIDGDDGSKSLDDIVGAYAAWIEAKQIELSTIESRHRAAAQRHMVLCATALDRMQQGLAALREPGAAGDLLRTAFKLANHAMCLQRVRTSERRVRGFRRNEEERQWELVDEHPKAPTPAELQEPAWRPFQIAFILMALPSVAFSNDEYRAAVELIWFPTGGGKTEAYLGLAAFSIFLRRLRALKRRDETEDAGVQVLMRYTLRLLTAQQFQRAAALICAMEVLRRSPPKGVVLGEKRFELGMWTGSTPNTRADARRAYRDLKEWGRANENVVILERCPWCRAEMGVKAHAKKQVEYDVIGYELRALSGSAATTVVAACADPNCLFHDALPLQFVDEDMYDPRTDPASMVIGTVDKFAVLAWRDEARRLFGRDQHGVQIVSPPGLILRDELHLISGPLGTMVGLYETTIEQLCTDTRDGDSVPPKIVSSTATIRSYREQVRRLFGRDAVYLFPPPGLDAADSFFARHALDASGKPLPGRVFVGVHAPGLGSVQTTQVRVFSSLLQGGHALDQSSRDPWWTLLAFYNSLRELGGGLTLFHSDVPDYLWGAIRQREALSKSQLRKLYRVEELTGRLENSEVVSVISKLEVDAQEKKGAVDVCLASNIIEVGVDIDRLSLLTVVGQPKSTAQYIQVTGRIGRKWWERPGLVVTIYGPSKPRDRSHYERFRTYHQQLYAQVEPSSVTPFSTPALERGLHGAMTAYVRQTGPVSDVRTPNLTNVKVRDLVAHFADLARDRLVRVGHGDLPDLEAVLDRRQREWKAWQPRRWQGPVTPDQTDVPLLRWPGRYATRQVRARSWLTPTSMRNVDAECRVEITPFYTEADGAGTAEGGNDG